MIPQDSDGAGDCYGLGASEPREDGSTMQSYCVHANASVHTLTDSCLTV